MRARMKSPGRSSARPLADTGGLVAGSGTEPIVEAAGSLILATGKNDHGQLGVGTVIPNRFPYTVLPAGTVITDLAAGDGHALAVTGEGKVLAWGWNDDGQVGNDGRHQQDTPVELDFPGSPTITAVAAGIWHSMALSMDGEVYVWGWGSWGLLGNGQTLHDSLTPTLLQMPWAKLGLPSDSRITAIACGDIHCLALTSTGDVLTWGMNSGGTSVTKVGYTAITEPMLVENLPGPAIDIEGGFTYSLVVTSDQKAYGFGYNQYGQLGIGHTGGDWPGAPDWQLTPAPVKLPPGISVTSVAAARLGRYVHSLGATGLAVTTDGRVLSWGLNANGMLGNPEHSDGDIVPTPDWVKLPDEATVTALAAAYDHAVAITSTGRMLGWGKNTDQQLGIAFDPGPPANPDVALPPRWVDQPTGARPVAVIAGTNFTLSLLAAGSALGWGDDSGGATGTDVGSTSQPALVSLPEDLADIDSFTLIHAATGYTHSVGITTNGDVYAWGENTWGQLGNNQSGHDKGSHRPVKVQLPAGTIAVQVAAGQYHSLALTNDGKVFAWGRNNRGQLGQDPDDLALATTPQHVPGLPEDVAGISTTDAHSTAFGNDKIHVWGDNGYGQIGNGERSRYVFQPYAVAQQGAGWFAAAAGSTHTLGLNAKGQVYAWGRDYYGQLGDTNSGHGTDQHSPVPIVLPDQHRDTTFKAVAAGLSHSLALSTTGKVFSWGNNYQGQLGNGQPDQLNAQPNPIDTSTVPTGTEFAAITAGYFHSLAATSHGGAYGWGGNVYGQLGNGETGHGRVDTPQQVTQPQGPQQPGQLAIRVVAAGKYHSIAA